MTLPEYWLIREEGNTWFVALFMAGAGGILNGIANLEELCLNAFHPGITLVIMVSVCLIITSFIVRSYYRRRASKLLKP